MMRARAARRYPGKCRCARTLDIVACASNRIARIRRCRDTCVSKLYLSDAAELGQPLPRQSQHQGVELLLCERHRLGAAA
jgi:hypothetical protein